MTYAPDLPIHQILPALTRALASEGRAVLQAPPGAGKTTIVPPALLDAPWLGTKKILMLEPRRLAARAAARRIAALLGETVGQTVGYRVRFESRISPRTRIEVVTEGMLIRLLQADPELSDVGVVIFDEFHERALEADLGLALCWQARSVLRDDLRLLVMSATLDGAPVAALMDNAPILTSEGRAYPVETRFLDHDPKGRPGEVMAARIARIVADEQGSVLGFLPGKREIEDTIAALKRYNLADVQIMPLHGNLDAKTQDAAIRPAASGRRKIVLATAIAETSLTINGVRIVVDGGLQRRPGFDPRSGMTRLVTETVSRASADQRRGRAGREGPGICYRLWRQAADRALIAFTPSDITTADLAGLVLELAAWGTGAEDLPWLEAPPPAHIAQAEDLLTALGALDDAGAITGLGRRMARLPVHPRLAHMLVRARDLDIGALGCLLAAVLEEKDPPGLNGVDLCGRLRLADRLPRHAPVQAAAAQLRRLLDVRQTPLTRIDQTGLLLAFAYPDRIAQRRPGGPARFRLSNGKGARMSDEDPLAGQTWLACADLDGTRRDARIYRAAALSRPEIEAHFADRIRTDEVVQWDGKSGRPDARYIRSLGAVVLESRKLKAPPPDLIVAAFTDHIRRKGINVLNWDQTAQSVRARIGFLAGRQPDGPWFATDDAALTDTLEIWLAPYLAGVTCLAELKRLALGDVLLSGLDRAARQAFDHLAPSHWQVPGGNRHRIDYRSHPPVLAVKLQEMFGQTDTPRLFDGQVAVCVHLLSPAGRPLQITRDLAGFWAGSYHRIKAGMKGRYPKHPWPDDPLTAPRTTPRTARTRPRP